MYIHAHVEQHRYNVTYPYLQYLLEMAESQKEDTVVTVVQTSKINKNKTLPRYLHPYIKITYIKGDIVYTWYMHWNYYAQIESCGLLKTEDTGLSLYIPKIMFEQVIMYIVAVAC